MSTCIPTTLASSVAAVETTPTTSYLSPPISLRRRNLPISSSFSNLRFLSQSTQHCKPIGTVTTTAQSNNASIGGSSSGAASKPEASVGEIQNVELSSNPVAGQASEESISEFLAQVASLVKLVDSRDIVELQMKQPNCELLIRKKEAMIKASPPPTLVQSQSPHTSSTPYVSAPVTAPSASAAPTPVPKAATSSVPSIKSPMAGTFYRSPAPGAPAFVKVGDKVQKGQVLCIIEAMKLMNEIEADQSGTIVEVLAADGKSVSLDTPLFAVQP